MRLPDVPELPKGYKFWLYDGKRYEFFTEEEGSICIQTQTDFSSIVKGMRDIIELNAHAKYQNYDISSANHKHTFSLTIQFSFK